MDALQQLSSNSYLWVDAVDGRYIYSVAGELK